MKAVVMNGKRRYRHAGARGAAGPRARGGQVLVEVAVAGVNFMDIGVRQGMAWNEMPNPKILGVEGAGRVVALGEGVTGFEVGQRVAWVYAPAAMPRRIAIPATSLVPVPDHIDDHTAAVGDDAGPDRQPFRHRFLSHPAGRHRLRARGGRRRRPAADPDHQAARRAGDRPRVVGGQGGGGQGGRRRSCDRRYRGQVRRGGAAG